MGFWDIVLYCLEDILERPASFIFKVLYMTWYNTNIVILTALST